MADLLRFKKPSAVARLPLPSDEARKDMLDALLSMVVAAEKDPRFVGYAVVILDDDGKRISEWRSTYGSAAQLSRQVRREAALILKDIR